MAKLSFGVTGPTGALDVSIVIADTDMPRIMAYLMSGAHGSVKEVVQTGDMQSWVTRPATPEETAASYARAILNSLLSETVAFEKAQAAAAAAAAVTPIEPVG